MIELDTTSDYGARIRVVGVGGGGGNAINSMITRGLTGVDFIAANTDAQALQHNLAPIKVQVGKDCTRGLGAGADPTIGHLAVEESNDEITEALRGSDMVFVTAGMGGGTGTGGTPIVAKIARQLGALVVGIVTKPFHWEAKKRMSIADSGIEELRKHVDALIVIPNQKLMSVIDQKTTFKEAFAKVDDVLYNATRGISDIISGHGYINVDFADVRTIMSNMGDAIMGTGTGRGENRAVEAAQNAISSPLLDGISIAGAQGVLVNITAGSNTTMFEIGEAVSVIENAAGNDTNLIQGVVFDDSLEDVMMITVVATGFKREAQQQNRMIVSASSVVEQQRVATVQSKVAEQQVVVQHYGKVASGDPVNYYNQPAQQQQSTSRHIPANSPSGYQELSKYDEPAYLRRKQNGAIKIQSESEVRADTQTERNALNIQNNQSRDVQNKPAFLRKIMD